jgi:hypothetical protein
VRGRPEPPPRMVYGSRVIRFAAVGAIGEWFWK